MKAKQSTSQEQTTVFPGFSTMEISGIHAPRDNNDTVPASPGVTPRFISRQSSLNSNSNSSYTADAFDIVDDFDDRRPPIPPLRGSGSRHEFAPEYERLNSARLQDPTISYTAALRHKYPRHCVTLVSDSPADIIGFANSGNCKIKLDTDTESIYRIRGVKSGLTSDDPVTLIDGIEMGKYLISWEKEEFIVYSVAVGYYTVLFILKEPDVARGETTLSHNAKSDMLIEAAVRWSKPIDNKYLWVFDGYWTRSKTLWEEVQKASWGDVILDEDMKVTLTEIVEKFFDSEETYKDLGVPWKRGIIFHGPPGNGKTLSIKALMHQISQKYQGAKNQEVNLLYVRSATDTYDIGRVFDVARELSPCLLILEDIETIVTPRTRSYFFNEVDGLENNDGIMILASTNYLDRLDPGLSKRPSRFDRKYFFPLPSEHERALYCEYWRKKLTDRPIEFPSRLCNAIAGITDGFSFAYLKEAFVATLLVIASRKTTTRRQVYRQGDDDDDDLEQYELWREMKRQVKILRDDMDSGEPEAPPPGHLELESQHHRGERGKQRSGNRPRFDIPPVKKQSSQLWRGSAMRASAAGNWNTRGKEQLGGIAGYAQAVREHQGNQGRQAGDVDWMV